MQTDQTVFISSNDTATFRCPECNEAKTVDVSEYASGNKKITVTCTCKCGNKFHCRLEKRRQYRKEVNLSGKFTVLNQGGLKDSGLTKIVDISSTGLKLKMSVPREFPIGTELRVEFSLDDNNRTHIEKRVTVRNVSGLNVGVSFSPNEPDDPALGFYLMR